MIVNKMMVLIYLYENRLKTLADSASQHSYISILTPSSLAFFRNVCERETSSDRHSEPRKYT